MVDKTWEFLKKQDRADRRAKERGLRSFRAAAEGINSLPEDMALRLVEGLKFPEAGAGETRLLQHEITCEAIARHPSEAVREALAARQAAMSQSTIGAPADDNTLG